MNTPPPTATDEHETWLDGLQTHLDQLGREAHIAGSLTGRTAEVAITPAAGGDQIRILLDRSSLGTPEARALADGAPDEVARRIVARVDHLAAEHIPYYCPTSRSVECCPECSGWDVCCDRPDLHRPATEQGDS
ncbi:hypothetical protein [Micromonospora carbonacea]|uniref:Uncharacterized protein n=1 Tax=Micromonospora carbonacea TaxID=47853 RepID=A0A1C5A9R0_9ACTN|nr:hypothetical protein [Micromonospora carbonacea]SCF41983.1 hypothetical protein GA0070563_11223 [Micromonospora carbonacea]